VCACVFVSMSAFICTYVCVGVHRVEEAGDVVPHPVPVNV